MSAILPILYYLKASLALGNGALTLVLLAIAFCRTRRVSLLLLFVGLLALGLSVFVGNAVNTQDLFLHDQERSDRYFLIQWQAMFIAWLICCVGLGGELLTLLRRPKAVMRGEP